MARARILYAELHMKAFPRVRFWLTLAAVLAVPLLCLAAKEFSMPKTQSAFSYPAHDHHANENITVALDPYDDAEKAKIFTINYRENDLLPVLLVITNDSDQPIELSNMKAELVTGDRTKLSPATDDDILRRITHPRASGARVPIPFPTKRVKGGMNPKELNEIQTAQFKAKAVEPRSSQVGFLFFDVSDLPNPLAGAHFYLTGVRDSSGHELMYFDVEMGKAMGSGQ
jgi:hypothetical protein